MSAPDFFRSRLGAMIDSRHPFAVLANRIPWSSIEVTLMPMFEWLSNSSHRRRRDRSNRSEATGCGHYSKQSAGPATESSMCHGVSGKSSSLARKALARKHKKPRKTFTLRGSPSNLRPFSA
ncbi:hypothetical protein [Paraburkholderia fungorum]|uniref:hypothetical protein n=1 Tax=Paraburkholderia fungorum TaxID=134537 RepID=UPI0038B7CC43